MKKLISVISAIFLVVIFGLTSCTVGPQKIRIGEDACSFCKMSVADNRFGAEIVTKKGKVYIFDDTHCLSGFLKANTIDHKEIKNTYFTDFNEPHDLIESGQAFLMKSPQLRSPMSGNIAAFSSQDQLNAASGKLSGEQVTWEGISK
jgi:copper chaperone NosL